MAVAVFSGIMTGVTDKECFGEEVPVKGRLLFAAVDGTNIYGMAAGPCGACGIAVDRVILF